MKTSVRLPLAAALVLSLAACQTDQLHERELVVSADAMGEFLSDKPEAVQRLYRRVPIEGRRNLVLNHNRAGLAAMEVGAYDLAAESFDFALQGIEAIYADNEEASKARSLYFKENIKEFKGEPYERAMSYFYRGLLYLRVGDFNSARASFRGGMLQDSLAEETQYQGDFASLAFLDGWASKCQRVDELASKSFAEARDLAGDVRLPANDHNVLVVVETGRGPRKVGVGEFNHVLTFEPGATDSATGAEIDLAGTKVAAFKAEDLHWQATTRGGRPIDGINKNKAVWKGEIDTVANVLVGIGATTATIGFASGNDNAAIAGGVMLLMGAIAKANAAAMNPAADVRQWDNLPGAIHIATARATESAGAEARVTFVDASGQSVQAPRTVPVTFAGNCGIAWVRAIPALSVPDAAPGAVAGGAK